MAKTSERRHTARLTVPPQVSDSTLVDHQVRLVNLGPEGAYIEHLRPIGGWGLFFIELPPALGGIRLQGEVVWSRVAGSTAGADGEQRLYYQSGLHFTYLTAEQREALMASLRLLKAAEAASSATRAAGGAPAVSGETATGLE